MRIFDGLVAGTIIFVFLLFFSCQSESNESQGLVEDTRVWVKEAFDSVDYMKVGAPFNHQRAEGFKKMWVRETDPMKKLELHMTYAQELMKAGQIENALSIFNTLAGFIAEKRLPMTSESKRNLYSLIGVAYMRLGETQNCVQNHNHQSCFVPIVENGIHKLPEGSMNAIATYQACLEEFPDDLETKYLLNLAYMTLGKFPDEVPPQYRIDPSWFKSKYTIQPFEEIAGQLGLNRQGHAGGTIVDDFTNDGWLDIVVTSWDPREELIFYVNNGNGSFTDRTAEFGLKGHVGILNLNQTDFNNDGWLDIHLMRGAWYKTEGDIPNTLLMNTGKGTFTDVTLKAGLTKFAPTQASAWSDFNLDGFLDLVVANESLPEHQRGIDLYMNQGDGTFKHASDEFGLMLNHYFKGCVATDVNNDRYPDIYFTSQTSGNFLFINQGVNGENKFQALSSDLNPAKPVNSFPCWNFDFDNDGNEDLFASAYTNDGTPAKHWMLSHLGQADPGYFPKLYRNNGNSTFEEVGLKMGLNEVAFTMGCNFGDINTDGYLDFYLATGNPQYQSIVPNKMYLNMDGKRFEDVSYSGGFANIQKGHGVGFGDLDHDGDEDIYVVIGGAFDGDSYYNCLFENPNQDNNNWLILKLTGTTANKPAIGARVMVSAMENNKERKIARTVTSGASFGANSLALEIGLGKSSSINSVSVRWPCKSCADQTFNGFEINKAYELIQDQTAAKPLVYEKAPLKKQVNKQVHSH